MKINISQEHSVRVLVEFFRPQIVLEDTNVQLSSIIPNFTKLLQMLNNKYNRACLYSSLNQRVSLNTS